MRLHHHPIQLLSLIAGWQNLDAIRFDPVLVIGQKTSVTPLSSISSICGLDRVSRRAASAPDFTHASPWEWGLSLRYANLLPSALTEKSGDEESSSAAVLISPVMGFTCGRLACVPVRAAANIAIELGAHPQRRTVPVLSLAIGRAMPRSPESRTFNP